MIKAPVEQRVQTLGLHLTQTRRRLAVAESCTGGALAALCTSIAGSSGWFDRGWVTYSNSAKTDLLGVPAALLQAHGAVSEQTAQAMARGALRAAPVHLAAAVTGIAGPGGGSPTKPVGTVFIAVGAPGHVIRVRQYRFPGVRAEVREATVEAALDLLLEYHNALI